MSPSLADKPTGQVGGMLRAVFTLTVGTAFARVLGMTSQFILAIWLSPAEFGLWAAATSALVFASGLINLGEVNGYLSGQSPSFAGTRRTIRKVNTALMMLGLAYAAYCAAYRSVDLAVLCAIIAVAMPIQGESSLLAAAGTKLGGYGAVVSSQMLGAVCKLVLGVALAAMYSSAVAIAFSTAASFAVICASLYRQLPGELLHAVPAQASTPVSPAVRFKWATNSLMMQLPIQAGFVVAQFLSRLDLLGLYFFSYQITLGVSGLIAEPLARIGLSVMADEPDLQHRRNLALWLCTMFSAGMLIVVGVLAAIAGYVDFSPQRWEGALPMTVVLLASLPVRMTAPILDSIQQANNRWWQATALNAVDAIGTAIASASIMLQDATLLAIYVSAWKVVFGIFRLFFVLGRSAAAGVMCLAAPLAAGSGLVWASVLFDSACPPWLPLLPAAMGAALLAWRFGSLPAQRTMPPAIS